MSRLPEDTQTIHAELLTLLLAHEGGRDFSSLSGSFSRKRIRDADYCYFQYSAAGGKRRQISIGRVTPEIEEVLARYHENRALREQEAEQVARLARLLRSSGVASLPHAPSRVIRGLADAGVFRVGGILMGSYAFWAIALLLGREWPGSAWRTQDVDIASEISIAVPSLNADVPAALEALEMGFVPVPQLNPKEASTSFLVRGKQLRVDLITPGRDSAIGAQFIPRFRTYAAPIKYLSLAMSDPQPAVVSDGKTASLVLVPQPSRYALHKLLVSQRRSIPQQTKSDKDLHQAALILEALAEDRPDDLAEAAEAFVQPGPAVSRKVWRGLRAALHRWPEIQSAADILQASFNE